MSPCMHNMYPLHKWRSLVTSQIVRGPLESNEFTNCYHGNKIGLSCCAWWHHKSCIPPLNNIIDIYNTIVGVYKYTRAPHTGLTIVTNINKSDLPDLAWHVAMMSQVSHFIKIHYFSSQVIRVCKLFFTNMQGRFVFKIIVAKWILCHMNSHCYHGNIITFPHHRSATT